MLRLGTMGIAREFLQVGDLQPMQMRILCVGDLGLPTKGEVAHGNAVGGVGVGGYDDAASLMDEAIGGQDVR